MEDDDEIEMAKLERELFRCPGWDGKRTGKSTTDGDGAGDEPWGQRRVMDGWDEGGWMARRMVKLGE